MHPPTLDLIACSARGCDAAVDVALALGVIFLLTVLTVFLPAWAISGSLRGAVRGWAEWVFIGSLPLWVGALLGLAWVGLERLFG